MNNHSFFSINPGIKVASMSVGSFSGAPLDVFCHDGKPGLDDSLLDLTISFQV